MRGRQIPGLRCLVCGDTWVELHHYPKTRGMGGRSEESLAALPTVPLCTRCHDQFHHGAGYIQAALEEKAPDYWKASGQWERAKSLLEAYAERRLYLEAMRQQEVEYDGDQARGS